MAKETQRSQHKRDTILEAATRAFRDEGYETTSMDRIAELAEASKRTVYNHFGSKEALFQAVVKGLMDQLAAAKNIRWELSRSVEEQLVDIAGSKASVAETPALLNLTRVVLGVFIRHPELAQETMARAGESERGLIRWLEAAHQAGRLHVADIPLAAKMFWALASGALFWPAVFEGPMEPEARRRITEEVVATFLARHRVRRGETLQS